MTYRHIVHVDLDAFFASVEEAEEPSLRGKPVVVGASPDARGVVAAASYEARRYGVRSAMPSRWAYRLCPHAVFLPPRHELYAEYSQRVMTLLGEYSPLVEQVSIDEAYIDFTERTPSLHATAALCREIQARIQREVGVPSSYGVATNKLVAKVACQAAKPGGVLAVADGLEAQFLAPFPVETLPGIGPRTGGRLRALGVQTVGDLARMDPQRLTAALGVRGRQMWEAARGTNESPVRAERPPAKSTGRQHTFAQDVWEATTVEGRLQELAEEVATDLGEMGRQARTTTLTLRYADFRTISRSVTRTLPTDLPEAIVEDALSLLHQHWAPGTRLRLVGVAVSNLVP